jgi:hypothetical protein
MVVPEVRPLDVYLVDGTYELFRHYYALPTARDQDGCEVAAARGVLTSVLGMIKGGATHIAVATDHVIESFRGDLSERAHRRALKIADDRDLRVNVPAGFIPHAPHKHRNGNTLKSMILTDPPTNPSASNPAIPDRLERAIL